MIGKSFLTAMKNNLYLQIKIGSFYEVVFDIPYISNFMIHFSDFGHLKSEDIFTLALSSKEHEKSSSLNFSL